MQTLMTSRDRRSNNASFKSSSRFFRTALTTAVALTAALTTSTRVHAQSTAVVRRGTPIDRRGIDRFRQAPSSAISGAATMTHLPVGAATVLQPPQVPANTGTTDTRSATPQQIPRFKATIIDNVVKQRTPLTSPSAQPGKAAFALPLLISATPTATGGNPGPPGPATPASAFEPRIEVDSYGLAWQTQTRRFAGVIQLYIVDTLNPTSPPAPLPAPIVFHVTGDGASVDPESPQLTSTNVFSKINVTTARMDSLVHLHVTPFGLSTPIDINLRLAQAPLVVELGDTIPGLGFGRRDAMISFPAGFSMTTDSIDVSLEPHNGTISPEHVWISPSRPGHAVFRSVGLGNGSLDAKALGFAPSSGNVSFKPPIGFFLMSLLGVGLGTVLTVVSRKKSNDETPIGRVFVGGFVTGLVAAVAGSLLGVKIVDFEPGAGTGLIAVGVLAFVGALAGPKIVSVIAPGISVGEAAKAG